HRSERGGVESGARVVWRRRDDAGGDRGGSTGRHGLGRRDGLARAGGDAHQRVELGDDRSRREPQPESNPPRGERGQSAPRDEPVDRAFPPSPDPCPPIKKEGEKGGGRGFFLPSLWGKRLGDGGHGYGEGR